MVGALVANAVDTLHPGVEHAQRQVKVVGNSQLGGSIHELREQVVEGTQGEQFQHHPGRWVAGLVVETVVIGDERFAFGPVQLAPNGGQESGRGCLLSGRVALEKTGLLVPVVVAGVAGDVVDNLRAEGDFQPLNGFQAEQAQLLVELVAVQNVVEGGARLKLAGTGQQKAAPITAEPVVADVGQVAQGPRLVGHH